MTPLLVALPAVLAGWALGVALDRLSPSLALFLAVLLALLAAAPLPSLAAEVVSVAALVALPLGWGLRHRPPEARAVLLPLAGPVRRTLFWAPVLAPWLGLGLALAAVRTGVSVL